MGRQSGGLRMVGPRELNGVLEAAQIVPSSDHIHRMPHRLGDPGGHLTRGPLALILRGGLESEVQRLTLDLVEQQGRMGTTFPAVFRAVGAFGVVPRDGGADPVGRALNNLRDLATLPGNRRVAEQEQRLPTDAFVVRRSSLVPFMQFVQGQMGENLNRFDSLSLAQNRIRHSMSM